MKRSLYMKRSCPKAKSLIPPKSSSLKYKHLKKMPLFGTYIGVVETTLPEDSSRL